MPSKHETLTQCWVNVGPPSSTLAQHVSWIIPTICHFHNYAPVRANDYYREIQLPDTKIGLSYTVYLIYRRTQTGVVEPLLI